MKTLLLTLGLGLIAALQAQDPMALDSEEPDISGKWYIKAIVSDKGTPVRITPPMTCSVLSNRDLQVSFTRMHDGQCHEVEILLEKTSVPGEYTSFGGLSHLHVELSSVEDHRLFYCEGEFQEEKFRVAKLVSRNLEESPEALKEFKEFIWHKGLQEKDIFIPEQTESCVPARD
uniref:Lipocalin/cytosolic fatty-acid binding domain-containing protein n=1 Tax=Otolemur garnettii TaxID=30611 RepID=H0WYV9_OTOGA